LPLTKRERSPQKYQGDELRQARGDLLKGLVCLFYALGMLEDAGQFLLSLKSYFWQSAPAVIQAADMESLTTRGYGEVTYSTTISGSEVEKTTEVFQRLGSREGPAKWAQGFAVGQVHTVYFNGDGQALLGHWPRPGVWVSTLISLPLLGFSLFALYHGFQGMKRHRQSLVRTETAP